ncbi:alanyl-tRNA synthetase [Spirosomataceae bacterium TFI 002]|nr:alanyl-tRNA synthetase [Spirosomataceae bacterium TFI 002]
MTSHEIRQKFLDFFVSKEHLVVPSAPIVLKNDPTLMFNNAGMVQFKDYFLGNKQPKSQRITDTQKCLRVSGKHNDLEEVGFDTYHHTMFEMLGNWSFGTPGTGGNGYFKDEALAWSWELLTEVFKLPKERIYVSVFEGDEKDGVPFDQESFDLWKNILGSDEKILLGNKKDNFWEMGEVGPCGPCSEIHIDLRPQAEVDKVPGKDLVNADHPQVVEIWNNVFIQFERKADGSLENLPAKHVDTGMGFERLCMAIQGKQSNYDTDIFQNTIQVLEKMSGLKYGANGTLSSENYGDVAMRVIADHIRAVAFTIADGQLPSNTKAGYVIRRILRRAIRYGYSYLNFKEPFMGSLVPVLAEQFKDVFPELKEQEEFVKKVVEEEEKTFLRTLELGLKRLDQQFEENAKSKILAGKDVFELSDTFGFPSDLTSLIAKEKGYEIDEAAFEKELAEQKARSRKDATKEASDWTEINDIDGVNYLGYDYNEAVSILSKYRKVKTKKGQEYHIVLENTPFYAEMGGQVGDSGTLTFELKGKKYQVNIKDTQKENDMFIHIADKVPFDDIAFEDLKSLQIKAEIDVERHQLIMQNHTATHLMLAAFRTVLGDHIIQRGSYQNENLTRFDFSHFSKVTDEELQKVEDIVNQKIRQNIALVEKRNVAIKEATEMGATATFGEKYGDFVRVIIFDPKFSVELCGGSHVASTGEIGLFKFTSEGSVSAGVRRVEALTGEKALELLREQEATLNEIKELLKQPQDVIKALKSLIEDKNTLQKSLEALENEKINSLKKSILNEIELVNGEPTIVKIVALPNADALKKLCFDLKAVEGQGCFILGTIINDKPLLAVMLNDNQQAKGLKAGDIVKDAAKLMRGGGGGAPHFATAGGSDANGLVSALEKAVQLIS